MKQFLLMVNEEHLEAFSNVFSNIQVLEIQGMDLGNNAALKILVAPVVPPVPQAVIPPPPEAESQSV